MKKTSLMLMFVFSLFLFASTGTFCKATIVQWKIEDGGNGHYYDLTSNYSNWADAEAEAVAEGGHLVTINDSGENEFVATLIKDSYCTPGTVDPHLNIGWIGLEYTGGNMSLPDSWRWATGEPITFWNPIVGEFPCGFGVHMYIHGLNHDYSPKTWNNNPDCDSYLYPRGVIEVVPEPATLLLFGLGGLALLRKRK